MAESFLPATLDDLERLLSQGVLVESHHVDFKREVHATKGANVGIAKDIAAFSIDGGHLYIGVDEGGPGDDPAIWPLALAGLKERIDEIARSRISPPVQVRCVELFNASGDGTGCLVVVIPPTTAAAHQVDGRFWGRSDTTNYALSAAELDAQYARLDRQNVSTADLLAAEIARDPVGASLRQTGHLFVVAEPTRAGDELLLDALGGRAFSTWFYSRVVPQLTPASLPPRIANARTAQRAGGWGIFTDPLTGDREVSTDRWNDRSEEALLDVDIHENGGIRLFCGRATMGTGRPGPTQFLEPLVAVLALHVLELAHEIADTTGYFGSWSVGLAATGLKGTHVGGGERSFAGPAYSGDQYERSAGCTYEQLSTDPVDVAEKLLGQLFRGYSVEFDWAGIGKPTL